MNKNILMTVLIVFFSVAELYSEALFSGGLTGVDSNSGFNALRNPALMSYQKKESLSLLYMYSYLMSSNTEADVKFGDIKFGSEISTEEGYNGAFIFSSVSKYGKNFFGVGITRGNDGQVHSSSSDFEITGPMGVRFISSEEKLALGSTLMLSYSYRLTGRQSLGIQLETSASKISQEKDSKTYSGLALVEERNVEISKNRITSGLAAGYNFTGRAWEFGAGVKTGRFGLESQNYSYSDNKNSIQNDKKISDYYMHDEGIGLLAGFGLKPSGRLFLGFECGASVPYSYDEKECKDDAVELTEITIETDMKYALSAKGGLSYRAGRNLIISGGGSYSGFKSESGNDENSRQSVNKLNFFQLTAGADIRVINGLNILAGLSYNLVMADMSSDNKNMSMTVDLKNQGLDMMAGVTSIY